MSKKILILASANRDMMLVMDHMPSPGETFRGESYEYAFGGKGSNAAVATARQGADVTIATCLGDDANGKRCQTGPFNYENFACGSYLREKYHLGNQ